ncbi:MAG: retroviral-like aspartic protease family protein [Lutibacter sp.]
MKRFILVLFVFSFTLNIYSQTTIKIKNVNGVFLLPCKVNGLDLTFIIDTGASDVIISSTEAIFMLKNGYLEKEDIIGTENYLMANGNIQEGTVINLRNIKIGNHNLTNVKASIIYNLAAPLLLGQSALKQLGKFQFDYSNNTLILFNENSEEKDTTTEYGCVVGDCINGFGIYKWENGQKYSGYFKNNDFSGTSTFLFSNGNTYVGEFLNNKFHGKGTYTFTNGDNYVGEWKDDNYDGQGTFTFSTGGKTEGIWKNGEYIGETVNINLIKKRAEQGDSEAQFKLALSYSSGNGLEKDEVQAFKWYKRSVEQGNANAQNGLALMYEKGHVVEENKTEAFYLFRKSAENGCIDAFENLGHCFWYGSGVMKDLKQAFYWYKKSAESRETSSPIWVRVADMYDEGVGVTKNKEKAFYWYMKLAEGGNFYYQFKVGERYFKGEGVLVNRTKGALWLNKSFKNGYPESDYYRKKYELWKYE